MTWQKPVWYMILLVELCINRVSSIDSECEPCPSVSTGEWFSDLMVCNVNPRNATLIWTRDENTVNATYIVLYEVTGNQIRSDLISGDEEQFTHVITDLTPETVYDVEVCQPELNTCGSCEVEFTTPAAEEPSGPPVGLMIQVSGPSTLTVSWSAPLLYPEVVESYIVRCAPESDNSNIMELSRGNTRFNAPFHNLIPNTTYNCEVHTTSRFGNSSPARASASTLPRETVPGLMFIVGQNIIQYVQLSETSLAPESFISFLEDPRDVLNETQIAATVSGVDYHFYRKELYLTLSNGNVLRYNYSLSEDGVRIIVTVDPTPTVHYSAMQGNVLGAITVDWLFNNLYWLEYEGSLTKVIRLSLDSGEAVCEAIWNNRPVRKLGIDPVHGFLYWSVNSTNGGGLFRGSLNDFRSSQTPTCPPVDSIQEEIVFWSSNLIDFVLEPDVFIYFVADNTLYYIGFDKQNNGSFGGNNPMLLESFGEILVTVTGTLGVRCNVTAGQCLFAFTQYDGNNIEDILVFRKSKQPLPAPPSFPADVRVFSGPESATVSWTRPSFVQSLFGPSAYSNWLYCVNYTTVDVPNMKSKCTYDLQLRLSSLDNDTLYKLRVSAIGRGGERATPNELLFRTKPAGSEAARLLISTDAAVMVSDLDGLNMMDISEREEITQSTKESNGVAYDIRSSLYFWIIEGGQGPLYRYNTSEDTSSTLLPSLDTPISLASDWVGRRLFWVQDGINVADDRQLISINMDGGNSNIFDEDPRITSIAVDSLNGMIFWITGKVIMTRKLNGFSKGPCISVESEPLALTLDVEGKYLYWMSFRSEDNTVWLNQLNYTIEGCGTSFISMSLPGSLFAKKTLTLSIDHITRSSSRGVLTYGLGTLYLTTISSSSQSVYVLPANFAGFGTIVDDESIELAFGVIPQDNVVRDICVVSEILQPLPDGLAATGLSNIRAGKLSFPPRLRVNESSTSVIVIEWGESSTNIANSIIYEVQYTLTPFNQPTMDPVRAFTTDTFIPLEDQTFFTEVNVTVTPHTLWLESDDSLSVTSVFSSTPMAPGKVTNVRAYVYRPLLGDDDTITALIVWDPLNEVDAGGIVDHYSVNISGPIDRELTTIGNGSYLIVREFLSESNKLSYPLDRSETYNVQVSAVNSGGAGATSDPFAFSTQNVSPPQELLAVTNAQSFLYGSSGLGDTYMAVDPVSVNTISRLMYWYSTAVNSIMVQLLDGDTISVFLNDCPITVSTMAFEWQGERLYMAGRNPTTNVFELWRVPVVYSKNIERVHILPSSVQSLSNLVVDSFRMGRAFWLQENDDGSDTLEMLNLGGDVQKQEKVNLSVSAIALEPHSGDLWVSNSTNGIILRCPLSNGACDEVVDTDMMVTSIALDETMIYWTNGSFIASVDVADPNSTPDVWVPFDDSEIISIHTLSPGQQPQYYRCPSEETSTCLAPDSVFPQNSLPNIDTINVTNTSIEVWWSLPPVTGCCFETVFSYPLVEYDYGLRSTLSDLLNPQDPFQRHLKIRELDPYTSHRIYLLLRNIYSLSAPSSTLFIRGVVTQEGVPDPVTTLSTMSSGVTCIDVLWSGPDDELLHGPFRNRAYFLTYRGGSIDVTINVGTNTSRSLDNLIPDVKYQIEVKVSNGFFNSSIVSLDNVMSWARAPFPEVVQLTNTSMTLTIELEEVHVNISSVFIQAVTAESDGVNGSSSVQVVNGTLPMTLNFTLSSLSAYTYYDVSAVATYVSSSCNTNEYAGNPVMIWTESGVPDSPAQLEVESNGMASWDTVNPRTKDPRISYILKVIRVGDGVIVVTDDVGITLTANLNDMGLEVGQSYNVCVTAMNDIGNSNPSCVPYTHMPPTDAEAENVLASGEYAAIGSGVAVVCILLLIAVVIVYLVCRRRRMKSLARLAYAYGPDLELSNIRAQRYHRTTTGNNASLWSRETFVATEEELALLNQFPRQYITLENFLGQGEFGEVYQGTAFDILGADTGPHPVAIKTFRKGATIDEKHKFLSEAALMGKFDHPNIVKILGICVDNDPVFIIMELMPAGDLLQFLREARPELGPALLTREEQLYITKDIAQGCRYLEQQHFIHRDLAARNCLVSSKGADRIIKIGDFGLARDLYSSDYYRVEGERKLPVRWMAPEGLLQGKFTIESDVWAYGVLLYEVMSFGNQPYPGQSNQDVLQFVTAGGRLPKPDKCPQRIYILMKKCWRKYASERPRFEEICQYLDNIIEDMKRDSYCESDSDDGETLSREGSKRFPTRSPSIKSGFQNLVRSGSKKLRNSLRRHSMHRKEEQTTHTSVSSCDNLIPTENGDSFRESGLI